MQEGHLDWNTPWAALTICMRTGLVEGWDKQRSLDCVLSLLSLSPQHACWARNAENSSPSFEYWTSRAHESTSPGLSYLGSLTPCFGVSALACGWNHPIFFLPCYRTSPSILDLTMFCPNYGCMWWVSSPCWTSSLFAMEMGPSLFSQSLTHGEGSVDVGWMCKRTKNK